jgi:hypothetical protein
MADQVLSTGKSVPMDPAVTKALKEKRELQRRLTEIEQFLRLYKEFSGEAVEAEPAADGKSEPTHTTHAPERKRLKVRGPRHVVSHAKGILQDLGEPLTRGELTAELESRGAIELPGKDKESRARYVGTILWRHPKDFEHIEGKGYWLKGIHVPETDQEKRELRGMRDL